MHIFQNLKTPEQFQLERDKAIAKKRGVTLEEYRAIKKKEHEEEYQRIHMEELRRLGLTEAEFKKKEKKTLQKEKYIGYVKVCLIAIFTPLVLFFIYFGIPAFLSSSEIGKDLILIVGVIFVVGLVAFYLGTPVFLIFWAFIDKGKGNKYMRLIVGLIITVIVVGLILYVSGSIGVGTEHIEPGKMRPDRF